MYDQSCDLSPIGQRNLPKLDQTCIFQQGFRENYHPNNSPSCFYTKNSPLGECSSNFSTQAFSYPSNLTFGTAAMNALNSMHAQRFNPSTFGKMKPSSFSPSEHQMIPSERTSLEDTQNLLDGHNSCEEEDLEGGRSQIKIHSSSTILNYPPNADYSNKSMQFPKYGSSNTQKSYNPSLVPVKLPEAMQYQQSNIPQNCLLDQSGEFPSRHTFLEKNVLAQQHQGAYSGVSQPCEAFDQDQCSQGMTGENLFPLNFQYPSNFQSVGDLNHNTYQNHYRYQHHRTPHSYQNYHQFQQQIQNHQALYPDQSQITSGSISQSPQFSMFNQPQLSNSLHSTTQVDSPSNCTQQFHQYPGNEEFHDQFQNQYPQKQQHQQHLQQNKHIQAQIHQQHQFNQQQQQIQYSRLEEQQKSAHNNRTLLQYPRIQMQEGMYQQNQTKLIEQSHLDFHQQSNLIHPILQESHLASMPIMKIESIEQNSPNKSIEDCKSHKNDDIQEEDSSSQDSNHSSQSSSSSIVPSRSNQILEKQVKQPNENIPKSRKNPERIKGPNSQRINRSTSLSSQHNNTFGNSKISKKQTNETKNIPKNYSKAIIGYIQKHPEDCARLLGTELSFSEFESFLMEKKEKLTAIKDLRSLWTSQAADKKQETFNRVFRILSFKFFREDAVAYIYSSHKIKNTRALITYRFILQRALHDPESFQFMKFQN